MRTDILPIIFADFESYWADDYTLSKMPTQAYVRDERFSAHGACVAVNNGPIKWFSGQKLIGVLRALHEKYPNAIWVAHNTLFDMTVLAVHYGIYPRFIADTLAMSRALIGPALKKHSLDNVAKFLLGEEKDKSLIKTKNIKVLEGWLLDSLIKYCIKDVDLMRQIFYILAPHFPAKEVPVMTWVTQMMTQPQIEFDGPLLQKYHDEIVERKDKILDTIPIGEVDRQQFSKLTDKQIQKRLLMSNPLFAQLLEANGAVPPLKVNAKGKIWLAERFIDEEWLGYEQLEKMMRNKLASYAFAKTDEGLKALLEHEDERIQALVAARLEVKTTIEETRSRTYANLAPLGAISVPIAYSGAIATHRFSGRDNLNFQNLKRGGVIRNAIIAPKDYGFVVSDLSQIELRITLYLAGHIDAVNFLAAGGDLYSDFSSDLYGREIRKDRKEDEEERHVGKEVVLGSGFGLGWAKLVNYLGAKGRRVTTEFAKSAINLYRKKYFGVPKLWKFMEKCYEQLLRDGVGFTVDLNGFICEFGFDPLLNAPGIKLPSGLWLKYPDLCKDENGQWSYANEMDRVRIFGGHFLENLVQALARIVMTEKSVQVNKVYPVAMSTHDELTAVVDKEEMGKAKEWVHEVMVSDVSWLPGLKIGSETKAGFRYGQIK